MFGFSLSDILVSLIFSAIGFVYFSYGKKQAQFKLMVCGLGLMVYSYFTPTIIWNIGVGVVLSALPFIWR